MHRPQLDPNLVRLQFDEAYGELYALTEERSEIEVLSPLETDVVRLFFELADEAIIDPARDNPFAQEKRVFELSSETLAQELTRLQKLAESALNTGFSRSGANHSHGQLPTMLATMYVGATVVRAVALLPRAKAALVDAAVISIFTLVVTIFIAWFTAPEMRSSLIKLDSAALFALSGLGFALLLPLGIAHHLRPGLSFGYRKQHLEVVNSKSGNPVTAKTMRLRAWLFPLGVPAIFLAPFCSRWPVDLATNSSVRRNYALKAKSR